MVGFVWCEVGVVEVGWVVGFVEVGEVYDGVGDWFVEREYLDLVV